MDGKQLQQQRRQFLHGPQQQPHANREVLGEGYKNRDAVEKQRIEGEERMLLNMMSMIVIINLELKRQNG